MSRLIDAEVLHELIFHTIQDLLQNPKTDKREECLIEAFRTVEQLVEDMPDESIEYLKWERDEAIRQLEKCGGHFMGLNHDVLRVRRCRDCAFYNEHENKESGDCMMHFVSSGVNRIVLPEDYCSYAKKPTKKGRRTIKERVTREKGFDRT